MRWWKDLDEELGHSPTLFQMCARLIDNEWDKRLQVCSVKRFFDHVYKYGAGPAEYALRQALDTEGQVFALKEAMRSVMGLPSDAELDNQPGIKILRTWIDVAAEEVISRSGKINPRYSFDCCEEIKRGNETVLRFIHSTGAVVVVFDEDGFVREAYDE